jgi:AAA family ATP:ADP antiporter
VASLLVQLFVTSTVMQTWGVGAALLILPFTTAVGSLAFLAWPSLWVGSMLNTADNAFSYSVNQSAKEALYVPTTDDEKYKAKAFIDMFVQRAAKTVAVALSLAMGAWFHDFSSVRWLAVPTLALIGVWTVAARYAGRQFPHDAEAEEGTTAPAPASHGRPGRRAAAATPGDRPGRKRGARAPAPSRSR